MKTNTNEEISFTNCFSGLYLNKSEGAVAVDIKSSEIVLYLNTTLYQALAWLLLNATENKELMDYIDWESDPRAASKTRIIEIHGPEHAACLVCAPGIERVQVNLEIGVSLDLKFFDFKGLIALIAEAQNDLEWRRSLLKWTFTKDISERHKGSIDKTAFS